MSTEEKEFPQIIVRENIISTSVIKENNNDARAFAKILKGNSCGPFGENFLYLKNQSSEKKIGVTIKIDWLYENKPQTTTNPYILYPQQQIVLGCPIPGPTAQRFDYSLVAAWFE